MATSIEPRRATRPVPTHPDGFHRSHKAAYTAYPLDKNIFVYARDASEPEKQPAAAKWIEQLWISQRGRTGVQVLSEYYVTVNRKLKPGLDPQEAWADV